MPSLFVLSALAVADPGSHTCGFQAPTQPFAAPIVPRGGTPGELQIRDAFATGAPFQTFETDHTVVKWGPAVDPTPEQLELLGEDLELAWAHQVDELGWLPPAGSEAFKLNVYIGNSGGGAPEIDFSGGYVWVDPENFAFITLSPDSLELYDLGIGAASLVAHEFNHTLQIRNSAFSEGRHGPFLWEATASWAAEKTLQAPPSPYWGGFLLHPHLALDSHAIFGDDVEREGRQYDTALFVWYLTDQFVDDQGLGDAFIRDAWLTASPEDEPLAWLDANLAQGLQPVYTDFALRYALQTHDLAETYEAGMNELESFGYPDDRLTELVDAEGTEGWQRPPRDLRPEAWAWNRIRWNAAGPGEVTVSFEPNATGTSDTPASMDAFVVHRADGAAPTAWMPVDLDTAIPIETGDSVQLIVVSTAMDAAPFERFGYEYRFDADVEAPPPQTQSLDQGPIREAACGCQTPASSLPAIVGFATLLPLVRRRR